MGLLDRWMTLLDRSLPMPPRADRQHAAFRRLDAAYREPHRAYHTWRHIEECVEQLDRCRIQARLDPATGDCLEYALFYHDIVYQPMRDDNEARSAETASVELTRLGAEVTQVELVGELIMTTRHAGSRAPEESSVHAFIADIDLSILGADWDRFVEYDRQIRLEYGHLDDREFKQGRASVLESFIERRSIYSTPCFAARLERPARSNLALALERFYS